MALSLLASEIERIQKQLEGIETEESVREQFRPEVPMPMPTIVPEERLKRVWEAWEKGGEQGLVRFFQDQEENTKTVREEPGNLSKARPASEMGADDDGNESVASELPGVPRHYAWEVLEPESPPPPPTLLKSFGTVEPTAGLRYANAGSITLGAAALICVVLGAIQRFIPIFMIAGVPFGGLAWLCATRWPLSSLLHSIVLVSSLLLAGLVGVALDQDMFRPRYPGSSTIPEANQYSSSLEWLKSQQSQASSSNTPCPAITK